MKGWIDGADLWRKLQAKTLSYSSSELTDMKPEWVEYL